MNTSSTVIVTNISSQLEEHHLRELFECCGKVISLKMTDNQVAGREATIEFAEPTQATAAKLLSGTPLGDKTIIVNIKPFSVELSPSTTTVANSVAEFAFSHSMTPEALLANQQRQMLYRFAT